MKRRKILLIIGIVIILSSVAVTLILVNNVSKTKDENKSVATETSVKEDVKQTTTPESTIPKEETTVTPVTTPDTSAKVTTTDNSSKTTTNNSSKTTTSTNTGTKSGTTASTSGNTGSSKSGSTSGNTTTTPTTPSTTTPTPPPTTTPTPPPATPQPPKYTPSYTLREDLANEIFNAVSKYRQDNGLGALTRVSDYNSIAQNYLSYRIDGQPKPDITNVFADYTTSEGGWSAEALAGVIGRADRWLGSNTCSVKVVQKGDNYYVCFAVKK